MGAAQSRQQITPPVGRPAPPAERLNDISRSSASGQRHSTHISFGRRSSSEPTPTVEMRCMLVARRASRA